MGGEVSRHLLTLRCCGFARPIPMRLLSRSVVHNLLQIADYSRVLLTSELSSPNMLQKFVRGQVGNQRFQQAVRRVDINSDR